MIILLKGIFLGLLIAIPVGPVGMLCIQRTLNKGRLSGFISGLGAASADAFYGAVVAFGLVIISNFFVEQQMILRLVGGIFFIYIGIKSYHTKPPKNGHESRNSKSLTKDYVSTLFLTATNPMTIITFTALFAGVGFGSSGDNFISAIILVIGVFSGSTIWWLALCVGIDWVEENVESFSLGSVNKASGIIIVSFAIVILASLLV